MPTTSYSETSTFKSCRRKHYYNYVEKLEAIDTAAALSDGKLGHAVLETYYEHYVLAAQHGDVPVHEQAVDEARTVFESYEYEWNADGRRADIGRLLFEIYFPNEPFATKGYEILAVEREFVVSWDVRRSDESLDEDGYKFVIDLIVRDPDGYIGIIDHKFTGKFVDEVGANLQPQIPLYIAGIRGQNLPADYGIYNQLSTKKVIGKRTAKQPEGEGPTVDQALKLHWIRPTDARVVRSFEEQVGTALEIAERKQLPIVEQEKTAWRSSNGITCQGCDFANLCIGELMGSNTDLIRRTEYKPRERREVLGK